MNEKLKKRLVGAVVLVSLAIIFIPMMLDGGERSSMPLFGSNIPQKPDYHFEPLEIPLHPVTPIAKDRPVQIDKPEPAPEKSATRVETKPSPKTAPAKPAIKAESGQDAWVVQVGSFSQSKNALALRDKLRAKGFAAFVEKLKADGGTVYRVRIGPELKRENAEKLLQRLKREMQMKGIVMGHTS